MPSSPKTLFFALLGLFSLVFIESYAKDPFAVQKVRLAKAQGLLATGEEKKAIQLIYANIKLKKFHIDSFLFLARYHLRNGRFSKSFRAYYYIVKKIHKTKLVSSPYNKHFRTFLKTVPPPNRRALKIYYEIANAYYSMIQREKFTKDQQIKILSLAEKFFVICDHFKYKEAKVNLALGKISLLQGQTRKAIKFSYNSQKLFKENDSLEKKEEAKALLGESLIHHGFSDAGSTYLQSVYNSSASTNSLQQYANSYVDALDKSFIKTNIFLGVITKSNLHELSDIQINSIDNFEDEFGSENGPLQILRANLLFNKKVSPGYSLLGSLSLLNEKAQDLSRRRDLMNISLGADLRYNNNKNYITRVRYQANLIWTRASINSSLENTTTTHTLTPEYSKTLSHGVLTYGIPIVLESLNNIGRSEFGLELSYRPFWSSKWFEPIILGTIRTRSEGELDDSSIRALLSLTNYSNLSEKWSLFSTIETEINSNNNPSLDFKELVISGTFSYFYSFFKGLSTEISLLTKSRSTSNLGTSSSTELGLGLSYNF